MSIYSTVESGTSMHRSRFSKSLSKRMLYDCRFHELIPVLKRFVLPGDVWRIGGDALIRFQPMLSPTLTPNNFRVRYFFVPLRLIEENAELILTGSKNGKLFEASEENPLPEFADFCANAASSSKKVVSKYGFWDYMNVQCGDYSIFTNKEFFPAEYWYKGYLRIKFDFYRDENYDSEDDFDTWWNTKKTEAAAAPIEFSKLSKDYFVSSLPWQLKGVAPVLEVTGEASISGWDFGTIGDNDTNNLLTNYSDNSANFLINPNVPGNEDDFPFKNKSNKAQANIWSKQFANALNNAASDITVNGLGFNMDELRTMAAQTRIFERLARCGSRYVEYLRANFGIAPADGTLQRAQYLGGWKIPIVTSEVLQTAEPNAGSSRSVGSMYGHGISRGGNRIQTFRAKEFGLLYGLAEVRPNVMYTTGINRQLSYKRRFDFFNPSFQHLSEQEVRNGELYVNFDTNASATNVPDDNDDTLGFQAYANELRSYQDEAVGDMRDGMKYWNQALQPSTRPTVHGLMSAENWLNNFNQPFGYVSDTSRPIIVDFYNILDVYRPMVRYATPGLVDHL